MKKRTRKMLLAILMIIIVLATDFFVLGSGIITYASQLNSATNNTNIEFSAYFKDGENIIDSIEKSIKAEDVRLYAEIKVKNEGYLKEGTVIEIENSNFNLKNEILPSNTRINSIEGNKVNLKQINNGETIEIELGIEPIIAEKISTDYLSKVSTVKMISTYIYSQAEDGESITAEKSVSVSYKPDDTLTAELETDIITNKVFAVNGTNKRLVQLLIKSRLTNNEYPAKQTKLYVTIPQLGETVPEVSAIAINNKTQIENVTSQNGNTQITLNYKDENNQVNWDKNIFDEIVVTYIYPEVNASKIEIKTDSEIQVYNSEKTYTATYTKVIENKEPNSVVIGKTEITTEELNKGLLYANINSTYKTKTSIAITNPDVVDKILVNEGPDAFGTVESELSANTKYVSTEINLEKMLNILGETGSITIKNGEETSIINSESQVNENGNVVIEHKNSTSELEITITKPETTGILEINHTKVITGNNYERTQLQQVKTLNAKNTTSATLGETEIVKNITETATLELKETISKAELTLDRTTLSTTQANEVTLGISLVTSGIQYDLYKNPKISLKFPASVEDVELISKPGKQNADDFEVVVGTFDKTKKTMLVELQGEQKTYATSEIMQSFIQLNLNIVLESLALAQTDKIMMAYTNENAVQYENEINGIGVAEEKVEISAPSQLIKMFNISSNENTSFTETILQKVNQNEAGKTLDFGITLINNKDSSLSNLKILGKLPTTENTVVGQKENSLQTLLKGITAENATIYYTENSNATADINITENAWTQELSQLTDAKLYLIKVDSLERGAKFEATLKVQLPLTRSIAESGISYTQYGVIYDTDTETEVKESSRKIGLSTSTAASIQTEITAQVGQDILNNGDVVKEGEVIRYTVTVKNQGVSTLENVKLKLDVPEGTVLLKPRDLLDYKYEINEYFEEITDIEKIEEQTTIQIPKLTTTEPYTIEYEVRVKEGTGETEISNSPIVTYKDADIEKVEIKNKVEESELRITIEYFGADDANLVAGGEARYRLFIENISEAPVENLELQLISNDMSIEHVNDEEFTGSIPISQMEKNSQIAFEIFGIVKTDIEQFDITAIVKNSEGETYRANLLKEKTKKIDGTISISSPQNGQYIQDGQTIEYNILVKNTGEVESDIKVIDLIDEYLEVQEVYVNNEIIMQKTDELSIANDVQFTVKIKPQEQAEVKIKTKIGYIPEVYHGKTLTNRVSIKIDKAKEQYSEIVTHILKANNLQNENLENVISGFAWFDENENGKRDANEKTLSGIDVKLYDMSTKKYLEDENGNTLYVTTEHNGNYSFSRIANGSYLVVFEYDTEKYVLTTQLAENVDSSLNSKVGIKTIIGDTYKARVAAIELNNLKQNTLEMNIGLKENIGDISIEEQPGVEEIPEEPGNPINPDNPIKPGNPTNPNNPINPETPTNPETPKDPENPGNTENPEPPIDTKTISGFAWLDSNSNGRKDKEEKYLSGIKIRIYDVNSKEYLTHEITTGEDGRYKFSDIQKGSYIVIFEYNTEEYKPIEKNSNVVLKKLNINGQETVAAVTDTINVQNNISNINIGLKENLKFDLELNKYISKIVVQTNKETKTYDYEENTLGKVEIHRKQIQGALVVLEYTIQVKNTGEIPGYAKNIVDYIPSGLTFSSELNKDWYLSGNNLYTKSLENTAINPGEEKEIKLILTKTMTNENVGLINNRAEIYQDYNQYGESDIDSKPNNQNQNEDDFGATDIIIQVATGGSITTYIMLAIINIVLIYIAIRIMIENGIIEIKTKEERR